MALIRSHMSDGPPPITWAIIPFSSTQGVALCRAVPAFGEQFLQQEMINHLITIPRDNMTIKTKASRRLWLFKAKNGFLSADSRLQLDGCSLLEYTLSGCFNTTPQRADCRSISFP